MPWPTSDRQPVSPPRSSNRTCRFPASGSPTDFTSGSRHVLRLHVQFLLEFLDLTRCYQAHRQSPLLPSLQNASEVRTLCSAGITRLPRSYDPLRGPSQPLPLRPRLGFPTGSGLPPITQTTFPTCRAHYPGGPIPVHDGSTARFPAPGLSWNRTGLP